APARGETFLLLEKRLGIVLCLLLWAGLIEYHPIEKVAAVRLFLTPASEIPNHPVGFVGMPLPHPAPAPP
ncbi:unnamed protein product, partial [Ectocarpus sp. 4 AP-2014]